MSFTRVGLFTAVLFLYEIGAIARELVVAIYCMLTRREPYHHLKEETHTPKLKNLHHSVKKAQTNQGRSTY